MPGLTQAQQSFGTGGVGMAREQDRRPAFSSASGQSPFPKMQNPFGNLTSQQALDQRNTNPAAFAPLLSGQPAQRGPAQGPAPGGPAGSVGQMPQGQARPKVSPQMAGTLNAQTPGIFNGNPANGFPSRQLGTRGNQDVGGPRPLAAFQAAHGGGQGGAPPQQQPFTPPGRPDQQAMQQAQQGFPMQGGPAPVTDPFIKMGTQQQNPLAAMQDPQYAGKMGTASTEQQYAGKVDFDPATGAASFQGNNGNPRQFDDSVDWNTVKNQDNLTAEDYILNAANPAAGFWANTGMDPQRHQPLPDVGGYQAHPKDPTAIPWTTTDVELLDSQSPNYIRDDGVRDLAVSLANRIDEWNQVKNQSGNRSEKERIQSQMNSLQNMLSRYGIAFNPRGSGTDTGSGEGGRVVTGGLDPDATYTSEDGTVTTNPPPTGDGTAADGQNPYTPPGETTGRDPSRDTLNQGDTDLRTELDPVTQISGDIKSAFNDRPNGVSAAEWTSMMEFEQERRMLEDAMQRRQGGVNLLESDLDRLQDDPLRDRAEGAAMDIFNDPSGVDWQGQRNRLASDYDTGLDQATQAMSGGAARRGVPLGAMQGMTGQLTAENRNSLARALGEMSTQEQMQTREGLYRAIENAANTNRAFSGSESVAMQMLANAVMGTPQAAQNPFAGMSNTASNLAAIELAKKQAEEADSGFDWGGLAGQAGGALLGGLAGPIGAGIGSSLGGSLFGKPTPANFGQGSGYWQG